MVFDGLCGEITKNISPQMTDRRTIIGPAGATKINSDDRIQLSTKISTHKNNPLYGIPVKV